MYLLGKCYEQGKGVKQDYAKARSLYEKAAQRIKPPLLGEVPERAGEVEFHCRGSHVASPLGICEILVTDGCERAPNVAPLQKKELSHVRQLFFYN